MYTTIKRFNSRNILNLTKIYRSLIAYVNMNTTHFESNSVTEMINLQHTYMEVKDNKMLYLNHRFFDI